MQSIHNDNFLRYGTFVAFVAIWQFIVMLLEPELLPGPWQVIQQLIQHAKTGELFTNLLITLKRVAISFFIALIVGFFIGLLMGSYKKVDLLLDSLVTLALHIPALVTIILCFIWFGLNEFAAIFAVILNKIPFVIVTNREGVKSIDRNLMQVAEIYKLPHTRKFLQVFLPQMYPFLLASIRTGLSLIWKIVLVVELIGCSDGVGFQLGVFFQYFDIASILAYTIAFVLVIFFIELIFIQPWERAISKWRYA